MISVIITARQEEDTIGRAIDSFLKQEFDDSFEILVVAPDRETLKAAKKANNKIKIIQDLGRGKPAAMNLAIREAKGEILIFSDGDVIVDSRALKELLKIDENIVTGRPVLPKSKVQSSKFKVMFDYWQYVLFDTVHELRLERDKKNQFLLISGYLFLVKKELLNGFKFPENLLTEDEYLSYWLWQKGYKIRYADKAMVKVKYPDNYRDWVKQKVRTLAGGYQIPKEWKKGIAMRSFGKESLKIWWMWKKYVKSLKQAMWMKMLFMARLHVWLAAFIKVKLLRQTREKVWLRVESTK